MAAGDLACSTPTLCTGAAEIEAAVDALNLTLATDMLFVVPITNAPDQFFVFKVERAAA